MSRSSAVLHDAYGWHSAASGLAAWDMSVAAFRAALVATGGDYLNPGDHPAWRGYRLTTLFSDLASPCQVGFGGAA